MILYLKQITLLKRTSFIQLDSISFVFFIVFLSMLSSQKEEFVWNVSSINAEEEELEGISHFVDELIPACESLVIVTIAEKTTVV